MGKRSSEREWKKRLEAGDVRREDVLRRLAELACGRSNDCLKLATGEGLDMEKLDLSQLREFHRSGSGGVDVKLIDRVEVLKLLAALAKEDGTDAGALLQALLGGEKA